MQPSFYSNKKILVIAPQPFFSNRGTPLNVKAIVSRLAQIGYQVHLLAFPYGSDIHLEGVKIHRCIRIPGLKKIPIGFSWSKFFYDILLFCCAAGLSLTEEFSAFHGIEEGAFIAGLLGIIRQKPYVVDMDSCMLEQLGATRLEGWPRVLSLITQFERFIARRAAAILTVCTALTTKARAIAPHVRTFQIEDFPLEDGHLVDNSLVAQIKKDHALDGKKVLLYTGNFESYQGIDLLLEAYALVRSTSAAGQENVLLLVGGEADHIAAAQKLAQRLGMAEHVIFVGARPTSEMGSYMAVADVLVSPRILGGNTPLKIYTYMAAGKAIVATTIESHTQVLDIENAYLALPTPKDFSRALQFALDSSDTGRARRERIIANSKHLVETRFSKAAFDRRLTELYQYVLKTPLSSRDSLKIDSDSEKALA